MPHATEFTPQDYPPFPDSPEFKTVHLQTISLKKLISEDATEQDRVFEACKTRGFFYLEFGGCESGETILKGADDICRMAEDVFKLPMEVKEEQRMREGQLDGYKRAGATVTDKNGTKDKAEFFNIPKNDLTLPASKASQMSRQWPPLIMSHQPLLNSYMRTAHSTGLMILSLLATKLGINPSEITSRHRLEQRSGDLVRLTRGPPRANPEMPEIQTPSHTDFGTITLLMNWLGGLQVWSESARKAGSLEFEPDAEGEWLWVKPKKGCAIINLGDAMVRFTNGALCSGRHRVVPAPGEQGVWPRFSVVYFVRPEDECMLGRLEGEGVPPLKEGEEEEEGLTAKAWIMKQARGLGTQFTDN